MAFAHAARVLALEKSSASCTSNRLMNVSMHRGDMLRRLANTESGNAAAG